MSRFQTIKFGLERLLAEVRQMQLGKLGAGRAFAPDSHELKRLVERLAEMEQRLRIAQLQARSMESSAAMRARAIHDLPRDRRYGERQSIRSQSDDAEDLRQTAMRLATAIRDVYADLVTPTGADVIEKLPEALKQLGESFDTAALDRVIHQPSGPAWMPVPPPPQLSAADALQLALAMLTYLLQRRNKH